MKVSKRIQRRITFLFVFTAICLVLPILQYTIQLCNLDKNRGNENMRFIGMIDSHGAYTIPNEAYEPYIVPIQKDADAISLLRAYPPTCWFTRPIPTTNCPNTTAGN